MPNPFWGQAFGNYMVYFDITPLSAAFLLHPERRETYSNDSKKKKKELNITLGS